MGKTVKLRKGYDIKLVGEPQEKIVENYVSPTHAIKPTDFLGIFPIPKLTVQVGDDVQAGDPLFYDKSNPDMLYVAPVSGEIVEVRRGEKRAIAEVVILTDKQMRFKDLGTFNPSGASKEKTVDYLKKSGLWPFLRQRPYNVFANSEDEVANIFISGFDTAPYAPNYAFSVKGYEEYFQKGVDVLSNLTSGKVHVSFDSGKKALNSVSNAEVHSFSGPHPAGNVGVQIHHIAPINKGDIVWTVNFNDVIAIGRAASTGQYNTERLLALGGADIKNPQYYRTYIGANIEHMLKDNLSNDHVRAVSGNVLTGESIGHKGHIGFYDNTVSILEEGDKYEMFGWLFPSYARPSASKTFPAFLTPNKKFKVNTNTHGEGRAFVATGVYEKVLPMDIYPMQLAKSIMYNDFDLMEGLGLYEVVEEDLAICEFVCPSKTNFQEILRQGLDALREQG